METPFIFGRVAKFKNFTNRQKETEQLITNFKSGINTILISPRRWGKSSLVFKAALTAQKKEKHLRFCFIDLYNVRSEEQFYQLLAQEVLKQSSSKMEELMALAKKFIGNFIPKITFSPEPESEFTLSLDWKEVKKQPDEILNLAENISLEKNIKFIICIDEFQNLSDFEEPVAFQKKLRSHWQKHSHTTYCLYGSKRHMLMDVFTSSSMPFYKFGDILFLQKINENELNSFIVQRFNETGKKIMKDDAKRITRLTECHPYYTQQLAQQSWLRTELNCNKEIILQSHESLVMQLSLLFQTLTNEITNTHLNFLEALINEESKLSSSQTIQNYHLGTSANVLKIKKALLNKEIIYLENNKFEFSDPIFKYWLKTYYFKK